MAERGHAMAEATSSRLVIRSTSGVSMHSEATRHGVGGPGCARSLARPRAARHHIRRDARVWAQPKWIFKKPSSSSRFEGGNRPQRLGGAGTRDRMDFSGGVAQHPEEQPPCKRQAAGSNPVTSTTNQRLVNSVARVPACLAGSRGFDSRTRRQSSLPR